MIDNTKTYLTVNLLGLILIGSLALLGLSL
jgi:hypothetical protein